MPALQLLCSDEVLCELLSVALQQLANKSLIVTATANAILQCVSLFFKKKEDEQCYCRLKTM